MLDKDKFLTLMADPLDKINEMFKSQNIELSCWICRRKERDVFYGLVSERDPNDEKIIRFFGGEKGAIKFKIKLSSISLKSTKYKELNIPVCGICNSIIQERTNLSKKSKIEILDDSYLYR